MILSVTLKKGVDSISITDKLTFSTVFAQSFTIIDDFEKNFITISLDLNTTYKGSIQEHTYMDLKRLDADWSIVTLVEVGNSQVKKRLIQYLKNRLDPPDSFFIKLTAKNQIIRRITFENSAGLRMRVID
ncbi:MAG: hypothetical protein JNM22_17430 [Saprospiraceae bacterium]|nr:hypothetical protein [Saprospiraceae bacterium]